MDEPQGEVDKLIHKHMDDSWDVIVELRKGFGDWADELAMVAQAQHHQTQALLLQNMRVIETLQDIQTTLLTKP